jgi:hypothetical protein
MEFSKKKISLINDLVSVSKATSENRIKKYVLDINKEDSCCYVEMYQKNGKYSVCLRAELEDVERDEKIPIADVEYFEDVLSIIDDEVIDLQVVDNKVEIVTTGNTSKMPTFEFSDNEKKALKNLRSKTFMSRNYGLLKNKLKYSEKKDHDNDNPDSIIKTEIKRLKLKKLMKLVSGPVRITTKEDMMLVSVGVKKNSQYENTISIQNNGEKDDTYIKGSSTAYLMDIDCLEQVGALGGYAYIELKEKAPLILKKKLEDEGIGVNYMVTLMNKETV